MNTREKRYLIAAAAIAALWLLTLVIGGGDESDTAVDGSTTVEATEAPTTSLGAVDTTAGGDPGDAPATTGGDIDTRRFSDLPIIEPGELPPEAIDTLDLIADGGPFPYRQDDETFQNREGILPDRELGHYREYTVDTPGEDDRGARRIVAGADGELYYTSDHYDSFHEIVIGP